MRNAEHFTGLWPCAAVLGGLCLVSALGCWPEPAPLAPAKGRNVVLIVVDTLRPDRLPAYGCEKQTAPFLDELA